LNNTVVQDEDGNIYEVDYTNEEVLGGGEYDTSLIDTASTLISVPTTISNKLMEQDSTLTDGTLLGDPMPNPSITTNNNPYYGYFGCMRYQQNAMCSYDRYPNTTPKKNKPHHGIDISATVGQSVHALRGGTVVAMDTSYKCQNPKYIGKNVDVDNSATTGGKNGCHYGAGYGNKIIIRVDIADTTRAITTITGNKVTTYYILYAHLNTISVNVGDAIDAGTIIGTSGCSGNAAAIDVSNYHIHIEAHTGNNFVQGVQRAINPLTLLQTTLSDYNE
jgi:murein DD-endopeptidase MepM/ murein hydrolase activator NlpD